MGNISSEVQEVNEVKEIEDSESSDLNFRGVPMFASAEFRNLDSRGTRMLRGRPGFSFTSCTSFTSFSSLAFTGVYS